MQKNRLQILNIFISNFLFTGLIYGCLTCFFAIRAEAQLISLNNPVFDPSGNAEGNASMSKMNEQLRKQAMDLGYQAEDMVPTRMNTSTGQISFKRKGTDEWVPVSKNANSKQNVSMDSAASARREAIKKRYQELQNQEPVNLETIQRRLREEKAAGRTQAENTDGFTHESSNNNKPSQSKMSVFCIKGDIFGIEDIAPPAYTDAIINSLSDAGDNISGIVERRNGKWLLWAAGAKHTLKGTIAYKGYIFASDEGDPLVFICDKEDGYSYLKGKGIITMPDNTTVSLPEKKVIVRSSSASDNTPMPDAKNARLNQQKVKNSPELSGSNEVRIRNPNDFAVKVELRSGSGHKQFDVNSNGVASAYVPDGQYDVFFEYSSEPGSLYQGDSFSLNKNGIEIQIVKIVNGNFGIRKIR